MKQSQLHYGGDLNNSKSVKDRRLSRQLKRFQIVKAIRDNKLVSRHDLSRITNLDAPTVSRLTRELINEDVLEEVGKDSTTSTGRRPVWLSLKKASRFLIGLDIGGYETKAVLTNLENEVICRHSVLTYRGDDRQEMLDFLTGIIQELLNQSDIPQKDVEGIGLGTSGVIDPDQGKVTISCNLPGIRNIELVDYVQNYFSVPTEICNAGGAWSLSECEKCRSQSTEPDFVIMHAGYGISLSNLIDGRAVIGRSAKNKADFGHVTYSADGPDCKCGSKGCLESYVSGWAIARDGQEAASDTLLELVDGNRGAITAKVVFEAALRGDNESLKIIRRAGEIMGETAFRFIEFFMPKQVIFTGNLVTNSSPYYDALIGAVARHMPKDEFERLDFQVTSLDKYAGAVGVTYLLAHDILHAPVKDMIRIGW